MIPATVYPDPCPRCGDSHEWCPEARATKRQLAKGEALEAEASRLWRIAQEGHPGWVFKTWRRNAVWKAQDRARRELRALYLAQDSREGRNAVAGARRALRQLAALLGVPWGV